MPATTFGGSSTLPGTNDSLKRMHSVMSKLEAVRTGRTPMTKEVAAVLRDNDLSIEECVEMMQSMFENALGQRATALAAAMGQALKSDGATDYVEAIKVMAAQRSL